MLPLLWSLAVDGLLRELNQGGVYAQGCALCTKDTTEIVYQRRTRRQSYKNISDSLIAFTGRRNLLQLKELKL